MADLLVVTGPPGSGKSTVSAVVVDAFEHAVLVPGDVFFSFWRRGGLPPWLPDAHAQNTVATTAAAAAAGSFAGGGWTVVYDGVVGPWFLPLFAAAAGPADLHYAVLLPSEERCVAGVRNREGHGFTDETATRSMHREFASSPLDARHLLVDPPERPVETAAIVLDRLRAGTLRYRA